MAEDFSSYVGKPRPCPSSFYRGRDSDLVRRVRGETDFLVDIVPSQRDLATVSDAFTGVIESYEASISNIFNIDGSCHPDTSYIAPVSQRLGSPENFMLAKTRFTHRRQTWERCLIPVDLGLQWHRRI